jgi:hypothetical protein
MGICILLRVYQIKSLDKPSFATSIVRVFYFMHFFMLTTCFGPDQRPSSSDIICLFPFYLQAVQIHSANGVKLLEA